MKYLLFCGVVTVLLTLVGCSGFPIANSNDFPTAAFSVSSSNGLTVRFDGSESENPFDEPLTFSWDFGDDETGDGEIANHTYDIAGTYNVSLTVDNGRARNTTVAAVTVGDGTDTIDWNRNLFNQSVSNNPLPNDLEIERLKLFDFSDQAEGVEVFLQPQDGAVYNYGGLAEDDQTVTTFPFRVRGEDDISVTPVLSGADLSGDGFDDLLVIRSDFTDGYALEFLSTDVDWGYNETENTYGDIFVFRASDDFPLTTDAEVIVDAGIDPFIVYLLDDGSLNVIMIEPTDSGISLDDRDFVIATGYTQAARIYSGDFDNTPGSDLLIEANDGTWDIYANPGDGSGNWVRLQSLNFNPGAGQVRQVFIGEFNNNGSRQEMVFLHGSDVSVIEILSSLQSVSTLVADLTGGVTVDAIAVGDINGDGDDDIAYASDRVLRWARNQGAGSLQTGLVISDSLTYDASALLIADIDDDGINEVHVGPQTSIGSGTSKVAPYLYFNQESDLDTTN